MCLDYLGRFRVIVKRLVDRSLVKRFEPRPGLLRQGTCEHHLRRRRLMVLEREGWATNKPLGFAKARPAHASGPFAAGCVRDVLAVVGVLTLPASRSRPVKPSRGKTESAHLLLGKVRPAASLARRES